MLSKDDLKNILHQKGLRKLDQVLACLAVDSENAKQVKEIKAFAINAGLRAVKKWNISAILISSGGLAIRTPKGWELTPDGKEHISQLFGSILCSPVPKVAVSLRTHLSTISDPQTTCFVEEAIECLELKKLRAAVVLSWVGAVSVLQEHVVQNKLSVFNAEAHRRNSKWKVAKKKDDLSNMKEFTFLDVLESISVIGKSVKDELKACLKFRNSCGHPNSLRIGESRVAAHVETLILNVFSTFHI